MKFDDMFKIIKELEFDKKTVLCEDEEGVQLYVIRPSKLPKRLKNTYDVNKNLNSK